MKSSLNVMLFGSALAAFSAYSAAAPVNDATDTSAGRGGPVVVTAGRTREDDARISAEVRRRIDERPSLRSFNIVVYASDHSVYLEGLVDTALDRDLGEAIAAAVPGVSRVYDELAVLGS